RSISRAGDSGIEVEFLNAEMTDRGRTVIASEFPDLASDDTNSPTKLLVTVSEDLLIETRRTAVKQNLTTLRNRVNEFGVAEPVIQQQGEDRIVVQLPGV